uniref:Uncharacterized protein n=1 Tax=Daphnia magna TaxID=35525 RepID=A0A0P5A2Y1_9CRUS
MGPCGKRPRNTRADLLHITAEGNSRRKFAFPHLTFQIRLRKDELVKIRCQYTMVPVQYVTRAIFFFQNLTFIVLYAQ